MGPWSFIPDQVRLWVRALIKELNTPDPWKALPGYADVADLRIAPNVANTQFTFFETEKIAKAINEVRRILLQHVRGSQSHEQLVHAELASLVESSKNMGRKDWFSLAIGSIVQIALAIALPPEVTRQVFEVMREALRGIVHLLPPIIASGQQLLG